VEWCGCGWFAQRGQPAKQSNKTTTTWEGSSGFSPRERERHPKFTRCAGDQFCNSARAASDNRVRNKASYLALLVASSGRVAIAAPPWRARRQMKRMTWL